MPVNSNLGGGENADSGRKCARPSNPAAFERIDGADAHSSQFENWEEVSCRVVYESARVHASAVS